MNGYVGSIDTDAGIGTILSHFNTEYINHVIDDSLRLKYRPFDSPMPNIPDVLERQFQSLLINTPDYRDNILNVRTETYIEIINKICSFYNLSFTVDFGSISQEELYGITHILYEIFVSRFTDYMIDFFVSYIVSNANAISSYLKTDEEYNKPKESGAYGEKYFNDPKFIAIHANINKVIYNMASYDIPLQTLLNYFLDGNTAARIGSMLVDCGDIYKQHYAYYILDQRFSSGILTNVKLKLQSKTQELNNV